MTEYDPKIILQSADRLYARAAAVVLGAAVLYGAVAGVAGYVGTVLFVSYAGHASKNFLAPYDPGTVTGLACLVSATVGLLVGIYAGRERAFALKLQAQMALVQLKTEENTRQGSGVTEASREAPRQ